ncbi:MFS transporter [Streptomyces sp. URMC 126]|uniref:MFS transporter n=1 Tax=Streptomyces sp. URMC 126 TaxID=3423401 RepID=UPI003F1A4867
MAVWGVGVCVYLVAIVFRTSLGVAGLDAADRFHINASALSTFSILQLLIYAAMQIPVGLMIDRLGTKRVLMLGAALFTAGQLGFALSPTYGTALASRALLGCGDAMTFISVLRLGSRWFPAHRAPVISQVAALFGTVGNLVSTLVVPRALHGLGWTATFAGSAAAGAVVLLLTLFFLKDHPEGHAPAPARAAEASGSASVRRQIAAAWREPGTRLGMWVHFTAQFPATVFMLLWGLPFLVQGQGLSREAAGGLLTLSVLSAMTVGPVYGQLISRRPAARTALALGTVAATALAFAAVLGWPGAHAPVWLLSVLCLVLGACGPASVVGFDFARPANPPERQGTASGIVNMGGFVASMTTLLAVGVLLDATGDDYRIAFCSVFAVQAFGVSRILRLRPGTEGRRVRSRPVASGGAEPVHARPDPGRRRRHPPPGSVPQQPDRRLDEMGVRRRRAVARDAGAQ